MTGGKRHALGGLFFEPAVMAGATAAMMGTCASQHRPLSR